MTFIAMISLEDCVILAADRETFAIYTTGSSERSGATARKITETADGFVTASGLVALIDPVKYRFRCESPKDVGHMLAIIEEEQRQLALRDPKLAGAWISKSAWKLSLPMETGVTAVFYDPAAHSLGGLRPGLVMMTYPDNVPVDEQMYVSGLFPPGRFLKPSESKISKAIDRILQAVTFLRERGRPVSREIDFAIHWGAKKSQVELLAS
jgi:hypothetical protein